MKIPVKFKCPSCDTLFVNKFSFSNPYYTCDNCTEYWLKEDGRQCPQCHKFGRNTEMPVCEDCSQEVEDCVVEVDADEVDVIDDRGDEIVSKKKATMRAKTQKASEDWRRKQDEIRQGQIDILAAECERRGITKESFSGYVLVTKTLTAMGRLLTLTAQASVGFGGGEAPPPFRLAYRLNVNADQSGWEGEVVKGGEFNDVHEMFARATEAMADPFVLATESNPSSQAGEPRG